MLISQRRGWKLHHQQRIAFLVVIHSAFCLQMTNKHVRIVSELVFRVAKLGLYFHNH